jgi:hypothetical protein
MTAFCQFLRIALSSDVPVWILTLLVGWLMLVSSHTGAGGSEKIGSRVNLAVVPLVSICTLTLKLSAAPIVLLAGFSTGSILP